MNPVLMSLQRQLYQTIIQEVNKRKVNFVINPRELVTERRNPIEKNYEILEVIGKGGFGEVKRVRHKELNIIRALKIINKTKYTNPAEIKAIKNEI